MATAIIAAPPTLPPQATNNLGRDQVHWGKEIWDRIDKAVHDEMLRARVGQRFLPLRPVIPRSTSVPTDSITLAATLSVDEGLTTRLNEYWVEFSLTPQQVDHETGDIMELGHSTAVTLATRAANRLALAEDLVIFQGQNAVNTHNSFTTNKVLSRGSPADTGLLNFPLRAKAPPGQPLPPPPALNVPQPSPPVQTYQVVLAGRGPGVYGEKTFEAVAGAISKLQDSPEGPQYGPYALVLQTVPYADTYAPIAQTLIMTADRIKPLMMGGFYGTGALPVNVPCAGGRFNQDASYTGVVVSLGGNTMDLVVGLDAITAFMQQDTNGNYRFRVVERFALRLKDSSAVVRLEFE